MQITVQNHDQLNFYTHVMKLEGKNKQKPISIKFIDFFIGNMTSNPQPQGCNSEQLPLCHRL